MLCIFRFYHSKNSERKRRQKSFSTGSSDICDSSYESSSDQVTNELSSEVSCKSSTTPPPSLTTEQAGSNEEAKSGLRTLRSSVILPVSWSDQSTDDQENMLLC